LANLDEISQNIFFLRYGHNFRVKEIATILGIKEGTIKSRLKRDIKKLQRMWPDPDPLPREPGA
jgi:RNA polymerase sigma factor (sigma-70 family)